MKEKIVFFNTGWMDFYKGFSNDTITGAGKYVEKEGMGHEIYNFLDFKGRFYGYVQPKIDKKYGNQSNINLEKLGGLKTDEFVDNVTVVWTARHPIHGGTYIIGWYLKARVYKYEQNAPKNSNRKFNKNPIGYYTTVEKQYSKLLSIDERVVRVKRQEKNWMGQSNVWYADNNVDFVELVLDYIHNNKIPNSIESNKSKGFPRQLDPLKKIEVEKSAIKIVTKYYEKLNYNVCSVEKDNVGWDLIASNKNTKLKLEVKGLSGVSISTELTANEYKNLKEDMKFYRLCIVTEALNKKPILKIFAYSKDTNAWTSDDGLILKFEEKISAKIYV